MIETFASELHGLDAYTSTLIAPFYAGLTIGLMALLVVYGLLLAALAVK